MDLSGTTRVMVLETGATTRSFVMSSIPLDLQRRFEQRWAARFFSPITSAAPQKHRLERQPQQLAALGKSKRKTRPVESAGLVSKGRLNRAPGNSSGSTP